MSYKATHWAWEIELAMPQKFILVALADMADEELSCFPGQETLARMTGASVRTVGRALADLEAQGLLTREQRRRKDGFRSSDRFVLHIDRSPSHVSESQVTDSHMTEGHLTLATTSPDSVSDLTRQSGRALTTRRTTSEQPDGFDAFWSLYPRHVAKVAARRKFETVTRKVPPAVVIAGLRRWLAAADLSDEKFIPHAATWLNQGRWEDEAPEPVPLVPGMENATQIRMAREAAEARAKWCREAGVTVEEFEARRRDPKWLAAAIERHDEAVRRG